MSAADSPRRALIPWDRLEPHVQAIISAAADKSRETLGSAMTGQQTWEAMTALGQHDYLQLLGVEVTDTWTPPPPEDGYDDEAGEILRGQPVPEMDPEAAPADDFGRSAADGHPLTDVGNAARFIEVNEGRVRYVNEWGRWIVWTGGRWEVDANDARVTEAAKLVSAQILGMVPTAPSIDERARLLKAGNRAESSATIAAMVRLARGIDGVIVGHEELDADPDILNVANGTVDLRTGALRPADPADLCTKQCAVEFDPDAVAPLWNKCLDRWQPDMEVREYLQREMGAGATGRPTETLSINIGTGANGKSKFFGAVQHVMGPYSIEPHKSLIVVTRHEQHPTVVAGLFRVRLAVASETSAAAKLDDEAIKNLTGGDRLRARRMREDEWSFSPSHTLVMFSNHRPEVRGQDDGIWRRVRLIEWPVTIPEAERDDHLADRLAAEGPGILAWIVEGAKRFLAEGLTPPASVSAATAGYRTDEDTVARFLADVGAEMERHAETSSSVLTGAHEAWCEDNGQPTRAHWQKVATYLKSEGCRPAQTGSRGRFWRGIRVPEMGL